MLPVASPPMQVAVPGSMTLVVTSWPVADMNFGPSLARALLPNSKAARASERKTMSDSLLCMARFLLTKTLGRRRSEVLAKTLILSCIPEATRPGELELRRPFASRSRLSALGPRRSLGSGVGAVLGELGAEQRWTAVRRWGSSVAKVIAPP